MAGERAVVRQGYVGLPLAMRAVEVGYDVVGLDVDKTWEKRLAADESLVEDVPSERLDTAPASGRYTPSTTYRSATGFTVAIITIPTPLREGVPDLSHTEDAARGLARHLRSAATVVESVTHRGTTEEAVGPIFQESSGLLAGDHFHLGHSPERIDPGNKTRALTNTPQVPSGVAERPLNPSAEVRAAGQHVMEAHASLDVHRADHHTSEVSDGDLVAIMTDHNSLRIQLSASKARAILDARRAP